MDNHIDINGQRFGISSKNIRTGFLVIYNRCHWVADKLLVEGCDVHIQVSLYNENNYIGSFYLDSDFPVEKLEKYFSKQLHQQDVNSSQNSHQSGMKVWGLNNENN